MKKIFKRFICYFFILALIGPFFTGMFVEAAAVNDYTQWRQSDPEWNQQVAWPANEYTEATAYMMSEAGCVVTSIAMLLRHYNVITTADVNQFNPWICNENLKKADALNEAADVVWEKVQYAYPDFVYKESAVYSLEKLISYYNQGYACIVQVNGTGGYKHYVAVKEIIGSEVYIMDPGKGCTKLSQYASQNAIFCFEAGRSIMPQGWLDNVTGGRGSVKVEGWAFDEDSLSSSAEIDVYAGNDGTSSIYIGTITADKTRKDVDKAYPGVGKKHGFNEKLSVAISGTYTIYAYVKNIGGGVSKLLGTKQVTIDPFNNPQGYLDSVSVEKNAVTVEGWAFDRDALSSSLKIHVYVGESENNATFLSEITADKTRKDVDKAYPGVGTKHGFSKKISTKLNGKQNVYVYAINVEGGNNVLIGSKTVEFAKSYNPQGYVDNISGGSGGIKVEGWAFDKDSTSTSLEVHVYSGKNGTEKFLGKIIADSTRKDVNEAYPGVGNKHGFSEKLSTNNYGEQTVAVYAINVDGGENVLIGSGKVTVKPTKPSISKIKNNKNGKMTISWNADSKVDGYKIEYATNSSFKNSKTVKIDNCKTTNKTVSVTKGKTYYVRICKHKGTTSSSWSSTSSIKIKK